jgi:O-antigen ligase
MLDANRVLVPAAILAPSLALFAPKGLAPALAVTALLALASLIRRGRLRDIVLSRTALILGLALGWSLLSMLWAIDPAKVPGRSGQLALLFFAVLTTLALDAGEGNGARTLRRSIIIGVFLGGFLLAWELATEGTLNLLVRGVLDQPGQWRTFKLNGGTALFLILAWPVMYLVRKKPEAFYGMIALTLIVTLLAISTTAKIALATGGMVFVLTYAYGARAIRPIAILAATLVLATPLVTATVLAPDRVEAVMPEMKRSGLHRLIMWEFAARRIAEKPIAGWGLGASRAIPGGDQVVPRAEERYLGQEKYLTIHPHNWAIQAWLELGFPGALLLAALAWLTMTQTATRFHNRTARASAAAAAATALVFTMASWSLWQAWWISALALGAALVIAACKSDGAAA